MRAFAILVILALSVSCDEPDPVKAFDLRDEWVGSYDYQMNYFSDDLTPRTGIQYVMDVASSLHFQKTWQEGEFDLTIDNIQVVFHGQSIKTSQSGYTFAIEHQTNPPQNPTIKSVQGFAKVEMDGGIHQGALNANERRIHFFLKVVFIDDVMIIEVNGVRQ